MHRRTAMTALAFALTTHAASAGDPTACPSGTSWRFGSCVPARDLVLTEPLAISSSVTVDCRGGRLMPSPTAPPMVAVVIHDTGGARLTGCRISGFEHGVYVLRTPGAASRPNWIVGNTIDARVKGISLWGAENTHVIGNKVSVASNFGEGIGLWRGSVDNVVRGNIVRQRGGPADEIAPADFPAGPFTYAPASAAPAGGIVVATGALAQVMVQVTVVGQLFQFPAATTPGVPRNIIEDNLVLSAGAVGIGLKAKNLETLVRGNLVAIDPERPAPGIAVGAGAAAPAAVRAPSTCVARPDRYCFVDADCNALTSGPADSCRPTDPCLVVAGACHFGTMVTVDFSSHGVAVHDNVVRGGATVGIDVGGAGMSIVGNQVVGASSAGIAITNRAAGDAWIIHNLLTRNQVGLDVSAVLAGSPLVFSENDVVGSLVRPIRTAASSIVVLELSHEGRGNYWGRACPDAFVPLPPAPRACTGDAARSCADDAACTGFGVCATSDADAPNDLIVDSHPFGGPVALEPWSAPCP